MLNNNKTKIVRTPVADRHPLWPKDPVEQLKIMKDEYPKIPEVLLRKVVYDMDQKLLKLEEKRDKTKTRRKKEDVQNKIDSISEMIQKMPVGWLPASEYTKYKDEVVQEETQEEINERLTVTF